MTEISASPRNKKLRLKFNRDKRLFRSVLISGTVLCITGNPLYFLVAHILATLFWDWFLFDYKNVKESGQITPEVLMQRCMVTPQQLDDYAGFVVNTRRVAFCISSVAGMISMFVVKDKFLAEITFPLTYIVLIVSILSFSRLRGLIEYPYVTASNNASLPEVENPLFYLLRTGQYNPLSSNLAVNPFGSTVQDFSKSHQNSNSF